MELRRLAIRDFRTVASGTELHFTSGFNVLLGKNAAGKTTLLNLVAAILVDDLSPFASEQRLDIAYDVEAGGHLIRASIERQRKEPPVAVAGLEHSEATFEERWTLEVFRGGESIATCSGAGTHGHWTTGEESLAPFETTSVFTSSGWIANVLSVKPGRPESLAGLGFHFIYASFVRDAPRFDEALNYFSRIERARIVIRRGEEGTPARKIALDAPLELAIAVESAMMASGEVAPVDLAALKPVDESIPFANPFKELLKLMGLRAVRVRPRLERVEPEGVTTAYRFDGIDFIFERDDGSLVNQRNLSFGEKRLFAFFWYLAIRGDEPLVADELVNGLHYDWIEACVDRLRGRQVFLATQNPLLLDHMPISVSTAASSETSFVRCEATPTNGKQRLCWRNLSSDENERIRAGVRVGIQQLGEILASEGLW